MPDRTVIPIASHPQIGKISEADYFRLYGQSLAEPDRFWAEHGKRIDWIKPFTRVCNASFEGECRITWYEDGTLNASFNCIDRHLAQRADQTAILWEGDDPGEDRRVTYRELHEAVCRLANALKARGVRKGDRVTIYLPMIPKPRSRCWPAPASARSIRWCSAASPPTASSAASGIAARRC